MITFTLVPASRVMDLELFTSSRMVTGWLIHMRKLVSTCPLVSAALVLGLHTHNSRFHRLTNQVNPDKLTSHKFDIFPSHYLKKGWTF